MMIGKPGGVEFDSATFAEGGIQADLTNLVSSFSYQHAAKIVHALLEGYTITPKGAPDA